MLNDHYDMDIVCHMTPDTQLSGFSACSVEWLGLVCEANDISALHFRTHRVVAPGFGGFTITYRGYCECQCERDLVSFVGMLCCILFRCPEVRAPSLISTVQDCRRVSLLIEGSRMY